MIQNSNATVIQNSNAAAIQNSNAAVIQNSNAAAIQNSNAAVIQNTNAAKRQNVDAVGTDGGSDDEAVTCDVDGVFALQRTALPRERPTGKKLDEAKAQMMRMHRAAGHSSFESLARLLEKRQAAKSVELARELRCSDCEESRRITPAPPASTEEPPQLWEYLGMDVFEHEFEEDGSQRKGKFLLMQDRASRLCVVRHLKSYPAAESWEPTTADIRSALINGWMAINYAVRRKAEQYQSGGLITLWRQRLRQGKGTWTGPLRVLVKGCNYHPGQDEPSSTVLCSRRTCELDQWHVCDSKPSESQRSPSGLLWTPLPGCLPRNTGTGVGGGRDASARRARASSAEAWTRQAGVSWGHPGAGPQHYPPDSLHA